MSYMLMFYRLKMFQLTAARRRLELETGRILTLEQFQLTAARRRLAREMEIDLIGAMFQLTAARRRLEIGEADGLAKTVSFQLTAARRRLGGFPAALCSLGRSFNSQPPEGGWALGVEYKGNASTVSTHSRPKAAGDFGQQDIVVKRRFNSQPPEGGWDKNRHSIKPEDMFQLTAARRRLAVARQKRWQMPAFQLTAARRRLVLAVIISENWSRFQLTAARRRLVLFKRIPWDTTPVSTHSRPKAAGRQYNKPVYVVPFQLTAARRRLGRV